MPKESLELIQPAASYREEFVAYCQEFQAAGEPFVHEQLPEAQADFAALLRKWEDGSKGVNLPKGHVPCSVYWLVRNGRIVATARLRSRLNEELTHEGGHIGYEVRPSERRKGYATLLLAMMLQKVQT